MYTTVYTKKIDLSVRLYDSIYFLFLAALLIQKTDVQLPGTIYYSLNTLESKKQLLLYLNGSIHPLRMQIKC